MKLFTNVCEKIIFIKNFALCVRSLANSFRRNLQFKYDCHQIVSSVAKSRSVLVMKHDVNTLRVVRVLTSQQCLRGDFSATKKSFNMPRVDFGIVLTKRSNQSSVENNFIHS